MRPKLTFLAFLLFAGCGETERALEVRLTVASLAELDPFQAAIGLLRVRVYLEGREAEGEGGDIEDFERLDDALADLDPGGSQRSVTFDGLRSTQVRVRVEGYDASGAVVAFGRSPLIQLESTTSIDIAFRRNLVYVVHRDNERQSQPARSIYVLDLASRVLVQEVLIPGTNPIARSITARGGRDGATAFVGLLSLDDHTFGSPIELPDLHDVTLGVATSPRGVALGGGGVTFVDFEAGTARSLGRPVGGRVLDAVISGDGTRALVSINVSPPGLLFVNLERETLEAQNLLPDPGGVALDASGRVAFVTSRTPGGAGTLATYDLVTQRSEQLDGGFGAPVDLAVYSESLRSVLGVERGERIGRIRAYSLITRRATANALETLEDPTAMATDGTGRRAVVTAAGSSTTSAGLTIVDSFPERLEGSGRLYPGDPDDTFVITPGSPARDPVLGRQRYQPSSVAAVYGR